MPDIAVTVFTPAPLLTISIERNPAGSDDVHLHAGGQGVWVARMLRSSAAEPIIRGPFGGEPGAVARMILVRSVDGATTVTEQPASRNAAAIAAKLTIGCRRRS